MTMRSLGLSIYPGHSKFEGNAHYLDLAHKYGFSRIFMSMLEVQGSPEETKAKYLNFPLAKVGLYLENSIV